MSYKNYYIDVPKETDASVWRTYGPAVTTIADWELSASTYGYSVSITGFSMISGADVASYSIEIWNGTTWVGADRARCILTRSSPKLVILDSLFFSFKGSGLASDTQVRIQATYGYDKTVTTAETYNYMYPGSTLSTIHGSIPSSSWSSSGTAMADRTWSAMYALSKSVGKVYMVGPATIGVSTGKNKVCEYVAPSTSYPYGALKFSFKDTAFVVLPANVSVSTIVTSSGGPMVAKSDTEKIDLDKINIHAYFYQKEVTVEAKNLNKTAVYFNPVNFMCITSSSAPWTDDNWLEDGYGWVKDPAIIPANQTTYDDILYFDNDSTLKSFYVEIQILDEDDNLIGVIPVGTPG